MNNSQLKRLDDRETVEKQTNCLLYNLHKNILTSAEIEELIELQEQSGFIYHKTGFEKALDYFKNNRSWSKPELINTYGNYFFDRGLIYDNELYENCIYNLKKYKFLNDIVSMAEDLDINGIKALADSSFNDFEITYTQEESLIKEKEFNLTPTQEDLLGILKIKSPQINNLNLLNMLNFKLTEYLSYYNVKFNYDNSILPINYYALCFIPSGFGKDVTLNFIDKTFFKHHKELQKEDIKLFREQQINKKKSEIYNTSTLTDKQKTNRLQDASDKLRHLNFKTNDGTSEGLYADLTSLSSFYRGSYSIQLNEIASYMADKDTIRTQFLNAILCAYDGERWKKTIKTENHNSLLDDINESVNFIAYSDLNDIINSKNSNELIIKLLESGLARRTNITFMNLDKTKVQTELTVSEYKAEKLKKDEAYAKACQYSEMFKNLIHKLSSNSQENLDINDIVDNINNSEDYANTLPEVNNDNAGSNITFEFTDTALFEIEKYKRVCEIKYNELSECQETLLLKEIKNRYWKVVKLAVVLACLEHPESKTVTSDDVQIAVSQIEAFSTSLEEFASIKPETPEDKFVKWIMRTNIGNGILIKDIRKQKFVHDNNFSKWFGENEDQFNIMLKKYGYKLDINKGNGNAKIIRLLKIK